MTRVITAFPLTSMVKLPPKFKILYVRKTANGADVWFEAEFEDFSVGVPSLNTSFINEKFDTWEITEVEVYQEFGDDVGDYIGMVEADEGGPARHIYMRKLPSE